MKVNFKVVGAIVLALMAFFFLSFIVSSVDTPPEDILEMELEEATGKNWMQGEFGYIGGEIGAEGYYMECEANGMKVYVEEYDEAVQIFYDLGAVNFDEQGNEFLCEVFNVVDDLYGTNFIQDMDYGLGGF